MKTSQVKDAGDIDFIKTMDSFKATYESMKILSQGDRLLEYEVVLNSCRWVGDDKSFGFKVGYTGGSDYVDGSVNLLECKVQEKNDEPE